MLSCLLRWARALPLTRPQILALLPVPAASTIPASSFTATAPRLERIDCALDPALLATDYSLKLASRVIRNGAGYRTAGSNILVYPNDEITTNIQIGRSTIAQVTRAITGAGGSSNGGSTGGDSGANNGTSSSTTSMRPAYKGAARLFIARQAHALDFRDEEAEANIHHCCVRSLTLAASLSVSEMFLY